MDFVIQISRTINNELVKIHIDNVLQQIKIQSSKQIVLIHKNVKESNLIVWFP